MNTRTLARILGLVLSVSAFTAAAEDIDLFMTTPTAASTLPNVLFMLDNSANWDASLFKQGGLWVTKKDIIHEALYQALTDPANTNKLAIGISSFTTKTGGKITAAVGAMSSTYQQTLGKKVYNATGWAPGIALAVNTYVLPSYSSDPAVATNYWNNHFYQVTVAGTTDTTQPWPSSDTDYTHHPGARWPIDGTTVTNGTVTLKDMGTVYGSVIQLLPKTNNAPYALQMYEDYLYYRGEAPVNGTYDSDYDHSAISGGLYVSPNKNQTCEKNFIVVLGNGAPDKGENTDAYNALAALYKKQGSTSLPQVLPLSPNNFQSNWSDEYALFFNTLGDANPTEAGKQQIVVYVIAIYDTTKKVSSLTQPEQGALALLNNIASQSQGRYFAAGSTQELSAALRAIADEVQAVNSVFASTTLPVSINVRGTNLNQVYMGVFRPDSNKKPDWYGNLKMYKLGYDATNKRTFLADSLGNPAESPVSGFVVNSAVSFWTHTTASTTFHVSDYPADTEWWWWSPRGTNSTADKKSDLPDGEVVEKGAASQWLREHPGVRQIYTCHTCAPDTALEKFVESVTPTDLGLATGDNTTAGTIKDFIIGNNPAQTDGKELVRSMVHGDVLHSRPATINYGPNGDDVVIYYGANDGVFHAVKGGETTASWTYSVGQEIWGFIPPELYTNLTKLYNNVKIDGSNPKPYFVDGTIAALRWNGVNYVYLTMRRGARAIYALSVNDNLQQLPTVAWRKRDAELPELGQTWSDPNIYLANISMDGGQTIQKMPVIVMGAGYDTTEDVDVSNGTSDAMGRGVYVLNAVTGDLIKFLGNTANQTTHGISANVTDSIPGGVKSAGGLDYATGLQLITTAYAADTGGNVWKLDLTSSNPDNWTMVKMASLGGTGASNRKFLYMPDVVNRTVGYSAVLLASGDREHPKDTTVQNYMFMLKDYYDATKNSWPLQIGSLPDTVNYTGNEPGWKMALTGSGEKGVGTAVTMNGVVFFNTNVPSGTSTDGVCAPSLGEARQYSVTLAGTCQNGTDQCYEIAPGGGFLPSPVPFTVDIDNTPHTGIISGTQVQEPPQPQYGHTTRKFWYKKGVDKKQ